MISISLISDLQKSPQKLKMNKKEKLRLIYEYIKIKLKTIYISQHSFKTS